MKTADFIATLAEDRAPETGIRRFALALAAGAALSLAVFLVALGPRPDFADAVQTLRFDVKFLEAFALVAAGAWVCIQATRPDFRMRTTRWALLFPAALVLVGVAVELVVMPSETWARRLVGVNAVHCLMMIPLMAFAPLAAAIAALRWAAPRSPALCGALAGAAAAGLSAAIYAGNCTDDSPLFVASWYSLAVLIVTGLGAVAGRKWLAW